MITGDHIYRAPYIEKRNLKKFKWQYAKISNSCRRSSLIKKFPYQRILTNIRPKFKIFRLNRWYTERLKRKKPLHKWIFDKEYKCSVCGIDDLDCYDKTCDEIIMQKALR